MKKKKGFIVFIALFFVLFISTTWIVFSLNFFDGILPPNSLTLGIEEADEYYEKKVSNYLLKNGSEFFLQSESYKNWNRYNDSYGFVLNIPKNFYIQEKSNNVRLVCYKEDDSVCPIYIQVFDNPEKIAYGINRRVHNLKKQNLSYIHFNSGLVSLASIKDQENLNYNTSVVGEKYSLYIAKNIKNDDHSSSDVVNNIIKTIHFNDNS